MSDHAKTTQAASAFTLETIRAHDFRDAADAPFRLHHAGGERVVQLAEIVDRDGPRAGGAFNLLFVDSAVAPLPQGIYPIEHARLGRLEIFLVPIGPVEGGSGYEAVFG